MDKETITITITGSSSGKAQYTLQMDKGEIMLLKMNLAKQEEEQKSLKTNKTYILKKDCPNIHKEAGDYYNNEYSETIEELIRKGVIEEEQPPE